MIAEEPLFDAQFLEGRKRIHERSRSPRKAFVHFHIDRGTLQRHNRSHFASASQLSEAGRPFLPQVRLQQEVHDEARSYSPCYG